MTERTCKFCGVSMGGVFNHPMCGSSPQSFNNNRGFVCYTCKNGFDRYRMRRLDQLKMLESQNGCCYLCQTPVKLHNGRPPKSAVIDHIGKPGQDNFKVRGILCHPCNTFLGILDNSYCGPKQFIYNLNNYIK